ncbi:glycosyltransferase family 4 protein [Pseudogracilibacillus auburnensis]|uniref:glycosyltransferase family 4 protein n=1 Tax=Pseudogracilibacillus auburnensis TaxID=1494959 RepID=UPI001A9753DF|nr:glycosyltransferase family 4 protein [Pseudogracilibacillus auburnensis]MBO1003220.1 glycosyltransferase family 4 protein [Pseudogracilibacillus auburnensis]
MRVCIIRNAEASSNAGLFRITDALMDIEAKPLTLTRSRFSKSMSGKFIYKPFKYQEQSIPNYELQFKTDFGRGIRNIFQLVLYQFFTTLWLIKNRKKFDVIHAFDLDSGIPALICSILTKKKLIYHIADFYIDSRQGIPSGFKKYVRKLEYFIIAKSDATIICTEERKEQIKGSHPKNLYVVHNSPVEQLQIDFINSDANKDKDDSSNLLTLGYVGGLSKNRFINETINFVKNNPQVTLKIAGFGRSEELVKEVAANYNNILYYGRVSYEDALKLYSECDVMFAMYDPTVPNHKYSAPNKVYEAMLLGLPIIVAKGTGIDKLVESEKIGFSIQYSEEEFNSTIKSLMEQKRLLEQFKHNSKEAFKNYSWAKMKKRVQEIYINL